MHIAHVHFSISSGHFWQLERTSPISWFFYHLASLSIVVSLSVGSLVVFAVIDKMVWYGPLFRKQANSMHLTETKQIEPKEKELK